MHEKHKSHMEKTKVIRNTLEEPREVSWEQCVYLEGLKAMMGLEVHGSDSCGPVCLAPRDGMLVSKPAT